jgi:peptidoglycan/xylan/chitin deacetylase (PgdA/CDA1 family)
MGAPPSLLARIDYAPLAGRPRLHWPNDARLAFWVIPNVEYSPYIPPAVRVGRSGVPAPDVPAYASRDYGNRVGFWRMLDVLDRHRIRCTVNINLAVLEHFPEIRDAMLARTGISASMASTTTGPSRAACPKRTSGRGTSRPSGCSTTSPDAG